MFSRANGTFNKLVAFKEQKQALLDSALPGKKGNHQYSLPFLPLPLDEGYIAYHFCALNG